MTEANPIFLSSGSVSAAVAPPHATVVSRRAKFVTPGMAGFVTCCAASGASDAANAAVRTMRVSMMNLQLRRFIIPER
jgi:hypothetical protein